MVQTWPWGRMGGVDKVYTEGRNTDTTFSVSVQVTPLGSSGE